MSDATSHPLSLCLLLLLPPINHFFEQAVYGAAIIRLPSCAPQQTPVMRRRPWRRNDESGSQTTTADVIVGADDVCRLHDQETLPHFFPCINVLPLLPHTPQRGKRTPRSQPERPAVAATWSGGSPPLSHTPAHNTFGHFRRVLRNRLQSHEMQRRRTSRHHFFHIDFLVVSESFLLPRISVPPPPIYPRVRRCSPPTRVFG